MEEEEKKKKCIIRESLRIGKELAGAKVTNMVGTFLNKGNYGFQKIRIATPRTEPEKVASTVTTFLKEDSSATAHRWFPENRNYGCKSGT